MNCPRCGEEYEDPAGHYCPRCGAGRAEAQAAVTEARAPEVPAAPAADLVLETTPAEAPGARCAAHPDREAVELCGRCGAFACPDCAKPVHGGAVWCAACVAREGTAWSVPWERRAERGLVRAYWETTRELLLRPNACFEGMAPGTGRWWDPISYALLSGLLGTSGMALLYGVVVAIVFTGAGLAGKSGPGMAAVLAGSGVLATLFMALSGMLAVPFMAFAWGGVEHLMLRLFGAKPRGYEATVRVCCYGHAPMILGIIPVCGAYVFPFWQLVLRILGFRAVHRTTGGKATAAVMVPVVVAAVVGGILYAASLAAMMMLRPQT